MRANLVSRNALRARSFLGQWPPTAWFIGGEEAAASHTARQGLLASIMIMFGSWGVGWLAMTPQSLLALNPVLLPLRTTTAGVVTCTVLLVFGALLLVRSWLRLSQRVGSWSARATPVMRRTLFMWATPLMFTLPIFSRDVYSYLAQGRVLHAGLNPYEHGVSELPGWFMEGADGLWAESPSPYGPLFLVLAQVVWFVSGGVPEIAILLFRGLSLIGMALMLYCIPRLAKAFGSEPSWALWLCLLNPMTLLVFLPAAHNDALMIGLMLAGTLAGLRRRRMLCLVLVVAAIAVKPIAMVVLPFILLLPLRSTAALRHRLREWAIGGTAAAVLLVAGGAALGIGLGWIAAALGAGAAVLQAAPVGLLGIGLGAALQALTGVDAAVVTEIVYTLARAAAGAMLAWMLLRRNVGNPVLWAGYGLTLVVLTSSIIQPWYLLWLLPFYAVVHVYRGRVLVLVTTVFTVMVLLSMVGQLSVAQWIDAAAIYTIAIAVVTLYLIYVVFLDPNTTEFFDMRRRSQRWNAQHGWERLRGLTPPRTSWAAEDIYEKDTT
ncbi:polyprenol phosphomannose-dependent alpha 1,6 mannosyltransferase MptB [Nesterenkonia sp. AY15]|uniref:polyprenol phosphomannose-dependent alpha 1,6 mannosyltransferase MptB n=1 Tax=Nesterenkonia sp. AY15 TaxID=2901139 RepID=UPI001F4CF4EC|nr:polyprenol phosphomannose-dependent alpha 1,6 mannosyltransferase MptB [Nesterenkonia sp. AY15]